MRKRNYIFIFSLALTLIAIMFFLLSSEAFPRAGSGQKYRPPTRSRPTYRSTYTTTPTYRSTYTSTPYYRGTTVYTSSPTMTSTDESTETPVQGISSTDGGGCTSYGGIGCIGAFVMFVIILIFKAIFGKKKGDQRTSTQISPNFVPGGSNFIPPGTAQPIDVSALPPIDEKKVKAQLAELTKKDPYFSEKVFLDKAQTSFFEIQRSWSRNDLEPVRKRMSEAQYNRMNMQLDEIRDKGYINKVEDIVIGGVKIAEAGIEGEYDFIKVRIHASMSDKTFDRNGKMVEGSNEIIPMAEYWTFIRKMGAKTNQDGGRTVSHNCPSCGAPVEAGESGKCQYCGVTITAASFDWVLDTITQSVEEAEE